MPVLNKTDVYREFPVSGPLRRSIACVWVRRGNGGAVRVLPDACIDIVWRLGAGAVVAGPDTSAWLSRTRLGEITVGARFLPGAGGSALGLPLSELRDQRVALSALELPWAERLTGAKAAFRLVGDGAPDRAVQAAVVRLNDPTQRVEYLANDLGLSERQLRRRFLAAVGYGPKTLQRVLRLRRFLSSSRAEVDAAPVSLAGVAFEAGYADQAHLARECRVLTGLAPSELIATNRRG